MSGAVILGPWGGNGGDAFDDGWSNGRVLKLTIHYESTVLRGFEVAYSNGTTKLHGRAIGSTQQIDFSCGATAADISLTVGTNSAFTGDDKNVGVVALGAAASTAPTPLPSAAIGDVLHPAQILGFFGSSDTNIDRLGLYISNSTHV